MTEWPLRAQLFRVENFGFRRKFFGRRLTGYNRVNLFSSLRG
jgi:hypothetical protein